MKKSLIAVSLLSGLFLTAEVKVPAIFSDHAVIQKSGATAVFGKADPGEKVSVVYGSARAETTASKDGKWLVKLDLSGDDGKSKELVVAGKNTIRIKDVISGEVWLCAGQSNMQFQLKKSLESKKDIAKSENNFLRTFKMNHTGSLDPNEDKHRGYWVAASPRSAGVFSAVGYYFGRKINAETGKSVGLIDPAWGSSSIQTWMSRETLLEKSTPAVASDTGKLISEFVSYDDRCDAYIKKFNEWAASCGRSDDEVKSTAPPADAKWSARKNIFGGIRASGILWFRKSIEISKKDIFKNSIVFYIGYPSTAVDFYFDGKLAGSFTFKDAKKGGAFRVVIPAKGLAWGKHEMTLRVHNAAPVFAFGRNFFAGHNQNNHLDWEMCFEKKYAKLNQKQISEFPKVIAKKPLIQKVPTMVWNAMMKPMVPYTMKGVIWYQGESNSVGESRFLYTDLQKAFIAQLRSEFENPDLPFYSVQLTGYKKKSADPNDAGTWSDIRVQQNKVMRELKNTGVAVILDYGESNDIHPIEKQPVGERLAAIALARDYGRKDVVYMSPEPVSAVKKSGSVCITFTDTAGGLAAPQLPDFYWVNRTRGQKAKLVPNSPGSEVEGFALKDKSGKWHWAEAKISGNTVTVSSPEVADPVEVRYAWQDNPSCNLFNKAGLPASTFSFKLDK